MAASGTIISRKDNIYGAYWSFEWTAKYKSVGVTTVSWNLYGRGRSSSPTQLFNGVTVSASFNGSSITIYSKSYGGSSTSDSNSNEIASVQFNNVLKASGSFNVKHDSSGKGNFQITFSNAKIYDSSSNLDNSETGYLNENKPYTKCGAPTSVSLSPSIVKPDGTITVTWSGATAGTSNEIKSYQVYWKVSLNGSNPTTSSYSGTKNVSASSTSTTFILDSSLRKRGYKIVCGVVTCGSAGASYYSSIKNSRQIKINQLPNAPTITSVSNTIVPSTGGEVIFNISKGTDPDGESCTLWYNTNNSPSTASQIQEGSFKVQINNQITYYFWTKDASNEYSSLISQTIIKNTQPTLTIKQTGIKIKSKNLISDNDNYIISPQLNITLGNDGYNNNKYTYKVYYGDSPSNLTLSKVIINNTNLTSYQISDIRSFVGTAENPIYYKLSAIRNDGIEDSIEQFSTEIYYVTKIPVCENITNKLMQQSVTDFDGYFLNELSVLVEYDEGYNQIYLSTETASSQIINLYTKTFGLTKYGDFSSFNLSSFSRGSLHNFSIYLKNNNNYQVKISEQNEWYRIKKSYLSNFNIDDTIKPFDNGNKNFAIRNWIGINSPTITQFKEYGIKSFESSLSLIVNNSNKTQLKNLSFYGDTLNFTFSADDFYKIIKDTNINKNSSQEVNTIITFRNEFGENQSLSENINLDFRQELEDTGSDALLAKESEQQFTSEISNWDFLKEGLQILYTGKWKSYNTNPYVQIQIQRIVNNVPSIWENYGEKKSFQLLSLNNTEKDFGPGNPYIYTLTEENIQIIKQILIPNYKVNFRIIVGNDSTLFTIKNLYFSENGVISVKGHTTGIVELLNAEYSNEIINFNYNIKNYGVEDNEVLSNYLTTKKYIQIRTVDEEYSDDNNIFPITDNSFSYPVDSILFIRIAVDITFSTAENDILYQPTTYRSYSNEISIYGLTPTISYRNNFIGLNMNNLDSFQEVNNTVAAIHSFGNNRSNIYFIDSNGITAKINIETKEIDNFVIDGGNW